MKEFNVGDRFVSNYNKDFIIEYLEPKWLVINNTIGQYYILVGKILNSKDITVNTDHYKFIGNFAKSHNFSNLYDLLNGD